jgi:hypothetical protein
MGIKVYYLELFHASEGTPHWARVVGYGPFSLCVIHKEGLCPSSGDINRLMLMKVVGTLTHADYPHRGSAQRPALTYPALQ